MMTVDAQLNDTRHAIQVGLTAILAWLALYLDWARNLFASDYAFSYMARLAPEHGWSVLFLFAANVGVIGLISTCRPLRLASVLVIATVHGIFAGSLLMADASVWSGTFVIIASMGYYLAYRCAREGV